MTARFGIISRPVYPRVCGGTQRQCRNDSDAGGLSPRVRGNLRLAPFKSSRDAGLSPRVRGNRYYAVSDLAAMGSIPACAGEPSSWTPCGNALRVYPRVCGGTLMTMELDYIPIGLSPRVRGNPFPLAR